ncbi:MAG: hypothetical protein ABFE02_11150 [Sulfuricella sp.]
MSVERRHRHFGDTIAEYIEKVPNELQIDAVGLWQVVPVGRYDFDLHGEELVDYVRRNIYALLERGAKPVVGATDGVHYWELQTQYGSTSEEIVNAVVTEWLAAGGGDPDPGGLWFALPELCEAAKK